MTTTTQTMIITRVGETPDLQPSSHTRDRHAIDIQGIVPEHENIVELLSNLLLHIGEHVHTKEYAMHVHDVMLLPGVVTAAHQYARHRTQREIYGIQSKDRALQVDFLDGINIARCFHEGLFIALVNIGCAAEIDLGRPSHPARDCGFETTGYS